MRPSTRVKSNTPSSGSMSSQETGASTVLSFNATSRSQIGRMYSRLDELELCSSPPRIRNGLLSTTSCVALPCLRRWGVCLLLLPCVGSVVSIGVAPPFLSASGTIKTPVLLAHLMTVRQQHHPLTLPVPS